MTEAPLPAQTETVVEEWLTVQQACALIGVAPATLRRWSVAGDVPAFTTPGGHRRFARSTILGLLPATGRARPPLQRLGQTPAHMASVYRRHVAQACRDATWLVRLDEDQRQELRDRGREITASLLALIDAPTPLERDAALAAALVAATECGSTAAKGSAGVAETVEIFLRFRMLFLAELVAMARGRGLDTVAATEILVTATEAIDHLQVGVISGHQAEMAHADMERTAPIGSST